jgi:hypothetical protein
MRKRVLSIVLVLAVVSGLFIPTTSAYAVVTEVCPHGNPTFNDKVLSGGVGNYGYGTRYYYNTPLPAGSAASYIAQAVYEWNYTSNLPGVTTSISIVQTTNQASSSFDILSWDLTPEGNIVGLTKFFTYNTQLYSWATNNYSTQNWGWNQILIDWNRMGSLGYSSTQLPIKTRSLISHEFGHAMGLSHRHNGQTTSIMYPFLDNMAWSSPSPSDLHNINHLYG